MTADQARRVVDVAVIGGGPAGAVTALLLARTGVSVAIVQPVPPSDWTIGEGLPPRCNPILRRLGLWEDFLADGHCPSYGNAAVWGSPERIDHSFLFDPDGHGWHLDRRRFDTALAQAASDAGAEWREGKVIQAGEPNPAARRWRLAVRESSGVCHELEAAIMVDASGRRRWLARKQRIPVQHDDWLVGCVALLSTAGAGDPDTATLVEATPSGWWYSAPVPGGQMVVAYMTDGDLGTARTARTATGWTALLAETEHTSRRTAVGGYQLQTGPRVVPANSSRLGCVAGASWLAVGDATSAYDPLSSQGILTAMAMGEQAATAVQSYLAGDRQAFVDYATFVEQTYTTFLANRAACYAAEPRWKTSAFWRRRVPIGPDNQVRA